MAKITRTFRFDAVLMEQFDQAAAAAGIDKTQVVTEAIQKFIENELQLNYKELLFTHILKCDAYELRTTFRNILNRLMKDEEELKQFDHDVFEYSNVYCSRSEIHDILRQEIKACRISKHYEDIDISLAIDGYHYVVPIYDLNDENSDVDMISIECEDIDKLYKLFKEGVSEEEMQKKIVELAVE